MEDGGDSSWLVVLVRMSRNGEVGIRASRDEAPPNADTLLLLFVVGEALPTPSPTPPFLRLMIIDDESGWGVRAAFREEEDVVVGVDDVVGCSCEEGFDMRAFVRLSQSSDALEVDGTLPICRHDMVELPSTPTGEVMVVVDRLLGTALVIGEEGV